MSIHGTFLHHESCPSCDSKDNLARYEDGYAKCFGAGCGYFEMPDGFESTGGAESTGDLSGRPNVRLRTYRLDLSKRGISDETTKLFNYSEALERDEDFDSRVHVAEYNGVQKIRRANKSFKWMGSPPGTLFGQEHWQDCPNKSVLVITEGEIDAMSVAEATGRCVPVVSVENGAASAARDIERNIAFVLEFERIILAFDNDEAGKAATRTVLDILPSYRVRTAEFGSRKDANEVLVHEGGEVLAATVRCDVPLVSPTRSRRIQSTTKRLQEVIDYATERCLVRIGVHSEAQAKVVHGMCEALLREVLGQLPGRTAVAAPLGMGKTTSVVGVIEALAWSDITDAGVLVLQPRIELGREVVEDVLIPGGIVKRDDVAHVFGGSEIPAWAAAERRFVFATHKRVEVPSMAHLLHFDGCPRGVFVDECLRPIDAYAHTTRSIVEAAEAVADRLGESSFFWWTEALREKVARGLSFLKESGLRNTELVLAPPSEARDLVKRLKVKAGYVSGTTDNPGIAAKVRLMAQVLESAMLDPTFTLTTTGVLAHHKVLPPELSHYVLLDATSPIDSLQSHDPTIQRAERIGIRFGVSRVEQVKNHRQVIVHQLRVPGGRYTLRDKGQYGNPSNAFAGSSLDECPDWAPRTVAKFIKEHARLGSEVLIVNYIQGNGEAGSSWDKKGQEIQLKHLRKTGVPVVDDPRKLDETKVLISFTTWGQHDASNRWKDAEIVVCVGDNPMSDDSMAAHILGMKVAAGAQRGDDENAGVFPTAEEIQDGLLKHRATSVAQAIGRGAMRSIEIGPDGETLARPMRALVFSRSSIRRYLSAIMPGIGWVYEPLPPEVDPEVPMKALATMRLHEVFDEMERQGEGIERSISSKELRSRSGLPVDEYSRNVFSQAIEAVLFERPAWIPERRGVRQVKGVFDEHPY